MDYKKNIFRNITTNNNTNNNYYMHCKTPDCTYKVNFHRESINDGNITIISDILLFYIYFIEYYITENIEHTCISNNYISTKLFMYLLPIAFQGENYMSVSNAERVQIVNKYLSDNGKNYEVISKRFQKLFKRMKNK
jgi:hypothetical protein